MNIRKISAAAALSIVLGAFSTQLSFASPLTDKQAQAVRLQAEIEANGRRISALAEQYNGAQYRLNQTNRSLAEAEQNLAAAERNAASLRSAVSGRAAELLKQNASGTVLAEQELSLSELETAAQRTKYAELTNERDRQAMNKLAYVQEDLTAKRKALTDLQARRKAESDAITKASADLKRANADQERTLSAINAEIRTLMAQEEERQRLAAQAAASASRGTIRDANIGPGVPANTPPSAAARTAIAFAQAQIGKPYVYAAAGPNSYDCSGLTMRAYQSAGIDMPHYSGAQYARFTKVPLDELLPGDLLFWGPGGSRHVGLYVGSGLMIHAPYTGTVVKVAPVHGSPVGAVRPWL
ncbi:MAG: NlpC/P60 family protein [Acidimicrobiia bacterium]